MTMKTLLKRLALGAAAGLCAVSGLAQAGETADGEQSGVLVCFYECKNGTDPEVSPDKSDLKQPLTYGF